MVPGWSVLSSGIHASEDALKTSGHSVLQRDGGRPALGLLDPPCSCGSVCVCIGEGDRGRYRRAGNVRDDTHASHAGRSRLRMVL